MKPIDPKETAPIDPRPPMAPPYLDENPNQEAVEQGMEVAENESREAAAEAYEAITREKNHEEGIQEESPPDGL